MAHGNGSNEDLNVNPLPGIEMLSAVGDLWTRSLMEYGRVYGKAWDQMQSGHFGVSKVVQTISSAWGIQYRTVHDLMALPFLQDSPKWCYFVFQTLEPNALVESVPLSKPADPTAVIKSTPLHAIGSGATSIVDAFDASWGSAARRTIDIRFDAEKLKGKTPGEYFGFIYNGAAASGPPLILLLLRII